MGKSYTQYNKTWRKIKQGIKHANYEVWKFTEKVCRKLLLLGRDTEFDYLEDVEGEPYARVNPEKLSDSIKYAVPRFHGKPRREHYMDQILRFIFLKWYEPIFTFKRWCQSKLDWFLFYRARELTWKTHHYINRSGTEHIDGYFEFKVWGIRGSRTVDLCSSSCMKSDSLEWDTDTKSHKDQINFVDLNEYGSWGFPTIMITNTDKVMPEQIEEVLTRWYKSKVEWKYRHWTWKGDMPKIIIDDLKFMEDLCQYCHYDPTSDTQSHAD